jgi:hypothetical protein
MNNSCISPSRIGDAGGPELIAKIATGARVAESSVWQDFFAVGLRESLRIQWADS